MYYTGIDIGSTCAKLAVMDEEKHLILKHVQPTGWSSVDTAASLYEQMKDRGIDLKDGVCAATGYGRVSVPYADKTVTEITCHGKGAMWIHHCETATAIDIGGQDTKVIRLENGQVKDFVMNDKCSAGTGRFLEVMANSMALSPDQLCALAAHGGGVTISSMCTVFAESEVISLIGRGEKRENIAYAVAESIVNKVASLASRLIVKEDPVCLTGGLCECDFIRKALEETLQCRVIASSEGRYAGAIGAALTAAEYGKRKKG